MKRKNIVAYQCYFDTGPSWYEPHCVFCKKAIFSQCFDTPESAIEAAEKTNHYCPPVMER